MGCAGEPLIPRRAGRHVVPLPDHRLVARAELRDCDALRAPGACCELAHDGAPPRGGRKAHLIQFKYWQKAAITRVFFALVSRAIGTLEGSDVALVAPDGGRG
jgi:hypothetical protein